MQEDHAGHWCALRFEVWWAPWMEIEMRLLGLFDDGGAEAKDWSMTWPEAVKWNLAKPAWPAPEASSEVKFSSSTLHRWNPRKQDERRQKGILGCPACHACPRRLRRMSSAHISRMVLIFSVSRRFHPSWQQGTQGWHYFYPRETAGIQEGRLFTSAHLQTPPEVRIINPQLTPLCNPTVGV